MPNEPQTHMHGRGKRAHPAYGSRASCKECSASDAAFEAARKHYAEQARQSARFTDGEPVQVDSDGIIVLKDEWKTF